MHVSMRIGNAAREFDDDGVEQHEADLLEQAPAELRRLVDRHEQDGVGDTGERAFRLVSKSTTSASSPLAIRRS